MSRFIGGRNIDNASRRMRQQIFTPIYDYAKEASSTHKEALEYVQRLKADSKRVPRGSVFALKYSSFNNASLMNSLTEYLIKDHIVLLDAEDDKYHDEECKVYETILKSANNNAVKAYKTYQMYRRDSMAELIYDVTNKEKLGIKLVRGAYLKRDQGTGSLFSTKYETDDNFNTALKYVIFKMQQNKELRLMVATHNEQSIDLAMTLGACKQRVVFAQLLGMSDDHGVKLVDEGYNVYKYVPYGNYRETLPYLLRRLYENYEIFY